MNHEIAKKLKKFTYFMKRDAKSVRKLWTILTTEWPIQGQKNKFIDNMTPPLKQEEALSKPSFKRKSLKLRFKDICVTFTFDLVDEKSGLRWSKYGLESVILFKLCI